MTRVRCATETDLTTILAILNHEIVHGVAHFGRREMTFDELLNDWRNTRDMYPWFVADVQGLVVGYAKAGAWKTRGAYEWATEVGVYIDPAHQGQGLAGRLYGVLFDDLRARGFRCVLAGISLPNEASARLHEAFGMKHVGTFPRVGFKHGKWIDVGYWALTLDGTDPPNPINGWSGG